MEEIIEAVEVGLLKSELNEQKKLCDTNKGGNVIYIVDAHDSPNVMREVGRLREISFREAGGSSGLEADIDEFDTMENPYKQIVVWDPEAEKIIGGYRYILGPDVVISEDGQPVLATSHMFKFSRKFVEDYLPHTMELGRSFVTPEYQSSKAGAKALFAMDNLWDGITSVIMHHPQIMYLFGKMTIYPSYDILARELIEHFLWKHFPDPDELVRPYEAVEITNDRRLLDLVLNKDDFKDDYKLLKGSIHKFGFNIPPLVNSYMNTSPTMKMLGTAVNHEFSEVLETGILVCFNEMYEEKRLRHTKAMINETVKRLQNRFPNLEPGLEERLKMRWEERRYRPFAKFREKLKNKKVEP